MTGETVKVLYVAGLGRSGSTLIANLLGQIPGYFSAGELRYVWERGAIGNQLCGCGLSFADCETWQAILDKGFPAADPALFERLALQMRRSALTRHIPMMAAPATRRMLRNRVREYLQALEQLYQAIGSVTGSNVIVDSSNAPMYGRVLTLVPSIETRFLHLIRDPRGHAYSWTRNRRRPDAGPSAYFPKMGPFKTSVWWMVWSLASESLLSKDQSSYMEMRYEDFVQHPSEILLNIRRFTTGDSGRLPFVENDTVQLSQTHTVSGHPSRLKSGRIKLELDDEWKRKMTGRSKLLVTLLTWPGMLRYGFPIRT